MIPLNSSNPARLSARLKIERRLSQQFCPRRILTGQVECAMGGATTTAVVQSLSPRGIGLVSPKTWGVGSELCLRMLNASATFYLVVTVRVVRCDLVLTGGYFLDCEFTRMLEPGELRPFLV
jgi:hypothetical protein